MTCILSFINGPLMIKVPFAVEHCLVKQNCSLFGGFLRVVFEHWITLFSMSLPTIELTVILLWLFGSFADLALGFF